MKTMTSIFFKYILLFSCILMSANCIQKAVGFFSAFCVGNRYIFFMI